MPRRRGRALGRICLDTLGPTPRAELLRILMFPDCDRAGEIQLFYANRKTRTFAELLIDLEESPHARGVVLELRERELHDATTRYLMSRCDR